MPEAESPNSERPAHRSVLPGFAGGSLTLLAATAIALYLCYLLIRPFVAVLTWGLTLCLIVQPVHGWLLRRVRQPSIAAGLAVAVAALGVIVPVAFLAEQIVAEAADIVRAVQEDGIEQRWQEAMAQIPVLRRAADWFEHRVDLTGALQQAASALPSIAPRVLGGPLWIAMQLLITFFTLYFFFRDKQAALAAVRSFLPLSEQEADRFLSWIGETNHAIVYGTILLRFLQGALAGAMFWILGLPSPLLWTAVMGVLGIIPVFGTFIVWIPAAIYLALIGNWLKAIILVAWGSTVVALVDNFLLPTVVGKRLHMHSLVVFFALVGGMIQFGASGIVLGPVIVAVTLALIGVWSRKDQAARLLPVSEADRTG